MAMVLFVVGMTALTSCTKSNEKRILGKWQLESISINIDGMSMQMTPEQFVQMLGIPAEEEIGDLIIEFKNDGYVYSMGDKVEYTVVDDKLTLMMDEDGPLAATITQLTDKEMVVEAEEVDEQSGMVSSFALYFKRV